MLDHEVRKWYSKMIWIAASQQLTRNYIPCIHSIFVFDEAKPIHELDFSNLTSTVGLKVRLDIGLCGYCGDFLRQWKSMSRSLTAIPGSHPDRNQIPP